MVFKNHSDGLFVGSFTLHMCRASGRALVPFLDRSTSCLKDCNVLYAFNIFIALKFD